MVDHKGPLGGGGPEFEQSAAQARESTQALRERALEVEQGMPGAVPEAESNLSLDATRGILHELRVHQVELELQNEELRRTQVTLEVSRERYFDLYDLAPVGYVTISEKGLVLEANLTAAGLVGVARGELVRQPWTRFIFPEDQDVYFRHRKLLHSSRAPQACELRMRRGDEWFWARLEARIENSLDGTLISRTVLSDIGQRKQVEQTLEASEARYRVLFEDSRDALLTLTPPGWQFTSANAAALELFRALRPTDLVARMPWECSPERQPDGRFSEETFAAMIAEAVVRGSHSFKWRYLRATGEEFDATVALVKMMANGAPLLQATVRADSEEPRQEVQSARTEREQSSEEPPPRAATSSVARGRILVVDDEPLLCSAMKRLLAKHEVVTASSGKAAQLILEQDQEFDLIVSDLMMPEMNGLEFHSWLTSYKPTLAKHFILVTGGMLGSLNQKYLVESGLVRIDKPFDPEVLVRVVSERLSASKKLSASKNDPL
jgi:PAS domain S-box-containing protein